MGKFYGSLDMESFKYVINLLRWEIVDVVLFDCISWLSLTS